MAYTPRGATSGGSTAGRGHVPVRGRDPGVAEAVGRGPGAASRIPVMRRSRDLPYWALGVVLVVAGSLTAALLVSRSNSQLPVLALARDVPVGQPLTATDLRVEQVPSGTAIPVVPAQQAPSLVGRVAAVPLRAGRLLAADDVGPADWPPPGQVVVAVALAPGAAPPELAAGMHVLVGAGTADGSAVGTAAGSTPGAGDGLASAPEGVVAGVQDNPAGTGGRVVSLLVTRQGAGQVTAIPATHVRLVILAAPVPPSTEFAAPTAAGADGSGAGQPTGGG